MNATQIYSDYLKGSLARAGMNENQTTEVLRKFSVMVEKTNNPGLAFVTMHEAYASEDTAAAALTVKAIIQKELAKLAGKPGPETNPLRRLKNVIDRFNAKLGKCSALINGKDALSDSELQAQKMRLADCLNPDKKSEAVASVANLRKKIQSLECEVKD